MMNNRKFGTLIGFLGVEWALVGALLNHSIWQLLAGMATAIVGLFFRMYDEL